MSNQEEEKRKFFQACADGNIHEVRRMISAVKTLQSYEQSDMPLDYVIDGMTPLTVAARNGHIQIIRFLLDEEADVNKVNTV